VTFDIPRAILALLLSLAVCACNAEKKAAATPGTASGEVLPRSASDAMLPYDSLRSQPPLAAGADVQDNQPEKPEAKRSSKPLAASPDPQEANPDDAAPIEAKPDEE
jgi:hypothetical protein